MQLLTNRYPFVKMYVESDHQCLKATQSHWCVGFNRVQSVLPESLNQIPDINQMHYETYVDK